MWLVLDTLQSPVTRWEFTPSSAPLGLPRFARGRANFLGAPRMSTRYTCTPEAEYLHLFDDKKLAHHNWVSTSYFHFEFLLFFLLLRMCECSHWRRRAFSQVITIYWNNTYASSLHTRGSGGLHLTGFLYLLFPADLEIGGRFHLYRHSQTWRSRLRSGKKDWTMDHFSYNKVVLSWLPYQFRTNAVRPHSSPAFVASKGMISW